MNRIKVRLVSKLVVLGIAILVSACGTDLKGKWATSCVTTTATTSGTSNGTSAKVSMEYVNGQKVSSIITEYSDTSCTTKLITTRTNYAYTVGSSVSGIKDTFQVDFTVESVEITPHTATLTSNYNTNSQCSVTSWVIDNAVNVTGKTCKQGDASSSQKSLSISAKDSKLYDIVKADNSSMQFGKYTTDKDRSTADKRPSELETSITYTLQK